MSQDIVSDVLNQVMNAKKAGKKELVVRKHSRLLREILEVAKQNGYLTYEVHENVLTIRFESLNFIRSVKPRFTVGVKDINKYVRRYLPAKNFGFVIVSTNQGLMRHEDAEEKNLGGCIVAYIY